MSEENVELVRRSIDAYNRRDFDGFLDLWAADAVVDWSNSHGFEAGTYRGRAEIGDFARRFVSVFEEVRIEIDDPVEIEEGLLVVENITYFRGRDRIEAQARSTWLIRIQDGRQASLTLYQTKQDALQATGVSR